MAATAVVAELARRLPNVTYHRATSRLAVGIDSPAPSGGTVAIVYDLALAATWRTLVDRDDHPAEEARRFIDGFGAGFGHMWATGSGTSDAGAESASDPRIPEHLLQRSRAAKAAKDGGDDAPSGGGSVAVAEKISSAVAPAEAPAGGGVRSPGMCGAAIRSQRFEPRGCCADAPARRRWRVEICW